MVIYRSLLSAKMIERLLQTFEGMGKTIGDVARDSGLAYDTLNQIKMGRVKSMRCDTLAAIITVYPMIDANYILTGLGKPILEDPKQDLVALADDARLAYEANRRLLDKLLSQR